jgi:hypothetical protein
VIREVIREVIRDPGFPSSPSGQARTRPGKGLGS